MSQTKVFFSTNASVWADNRTIPGRLIVTGDEVIFKSSDIYHDISYRVPLKHIVQVSKRKKWIFFDRFMFFRTREGRLYKFYFFRTGKAVKILNYLVHILPLEKK